MTARIISLADIRRRRARRDYMRRYRARRGKPTLRPYVTAAVIPHAVAAERDAALSAPLSPDQLLLGDPLPGRSALDRKRAAASKRSIWR
jgi:hypothetical protein